MANEVVNEQVELQFDTAQEKPQEKPQEKTKEIVTTNNPAEIAEMNNMEVISGVSQSAFQSMAAFKEAFTLGKYLAMSDLVPATYKGNPTNCAVALDIANRMGVSPMFVMQNLYVVKGIPSWSGQACMSIIRACGRFEGVKPVYTGEVGKESRGCHIEAVDVRTGEKVYGTEINMAMVHGERWDTNSKWKTMPEQMLAYRAATFFARVYCPNELMGFKVEGEAEDIKPDITRGVDPFAEAKGV